MGEQDRAKERPRRVLLWSRDQERVPSYKDHHFWTCSESALLFLGAGNRGAITAGSAALQNGSLQAVPFQAATGTPPFGIWER